MHAGCLTHRRDDTPNDHLAGTASPLDSYCHGSTPDVGRQFAFACPQTVVDRLNKGRFTSAGCAGDNVHDTRLEFYLPAFTRHAEKEDIRDIPARHTVRPIISKIVRVEPAEANQKPSRSEEHTSELQSLMRISYAVFC